MLAAIAVCAPGSASAAADCAGVFLFRPNDRLSVQEISSFAADSDSADGPNGTILIVRQTDWEAAAVRPPWDLLALVYGAEIGTGGGEVVGGTLWVRNREKFGPGAGFQFRRARDGVYATFKPLEPLPGCKYGYTFKLDGRGVLFANGVRVGQAKAEE